MASDEKYYINAKCYLKQSGTNLALVAATPKIKFTYTGAECGQTV